MKEQKKRKHLSMNEKGDIYVIKKFMNKTEDICETKTIISFLMKHIVTVTRRSPSPHTGPPAACHQILGCSRRPRWWSSWIISEGRTERWGSVNGVGSQGPTPVLVRTGLDHSHTVCGVAQDTARAENGVSTTW